MSTNVSASIAAKLKNYARANKHDVLTVLRRYAQERLLYRLAKSEYADKFCLKGGLLLAAYNGGDLKRPTEDIDFNGYDDSSDVTSLEAILRNVLVRPYEDDGVSFMAETMRIAKDREGILTGGKIVLQAKIHTARVDVRVDVGFGNAITPAAKEMEIPTLLADVVPRPVIKAYPIETVVSEKLHAIAQHGLLNTRMKDYFDLLSISETFPFDGPLLVSAIASTFARQKREIPASPDGLSDQMGQRNSLQWRAFIRKQELDAPDDFAEVVQRIRSFLQPAIEAARGERIVPSEWNPSEGWTDGPSLKIA